MRNCSAVETLSRGQSHAEEIDAVAHRLIPLVTSPTRNRPCDSPSLGPPEESPTPVREKLPQYDGEAEARLPIRGITNSLILDQRKLHDSEHLSELDRAAHKLCRRLLESDNPREQVRGLRFWAAIKKHQMRMRELEVQLAQVAIKAMTTETLARLQVEPKRGANAGSTPETVTAVVREVMRAMTEAVSEVVSKQDGSQGRKPRTHDERRKF